ncbi:hypothetical protein AAG906_001566 [Vitis piasezkii]
MIQMGTSLPSRFIGRISQDRFRNPRKHIGEWKNIDFPFIVTWTMISRWEKNWYWEESNEAKIIFLGCNY